jgi:hypothetical protein
MMGNVQDWAKVISLELCLIVNEGKDKLPELSSLLPSLAPLDHVIAL